MRDLGQGGWEGSAWRGVLGCGEEVWMDEGFVECEDEAGCWVEEFFIFSGLRKILFRLNGKFIIPCPNFFGSKNLGSYFKIKKRLEPHRTEM